MSETTFTAPIPENAGSLLSNRLVAIVLGLMVGLTLFAFAVSIHGPAALGHNKALPWLTIELVAICLACGFSVHSYVLAIGHSLQFKDAWERHHPNLNAPSLDFFFLVPNILVFMLAVTTILNPVYHLIFVLSIYLLFAWNNREVGNRCRDILMRETDQTAVRRKLLLMRAACNEENIPSVIVYAIAIIVLCVLSFSVGTDLDELKAFAGGAAAFHLVVSTLRYSKAISTDDALDLLAEIDPWPDTVTERMVRSKLLLAPRPFMYALFVVMALALLGYFLNDTQRTSSKSESAVHDARDSVNRGG
jgi:hypothetical protein